MSAQSMSGDALLWFPLQSKSFTYRFLSKLSFCYCQKYCTKYRRWGVGHLNYNIISKCWLLMTKGLVDIAERALALLSYSVMEVRLNSRLVTVSMNWSNSVSVSTLASSEMHLGGSMPFCATVFMLEYLVRKMRKVEECDDQRWEKGLWQTNRLSVT